MGTNYYLIIKPDLMAKLKGAEETNIHIGKSSGGWTFALRVYPGMNINSIKDWVRLFRSNSSVAIDEYDREVDKDHMLQIIANRRWKRRNPSTLRFFGAVEGPNNLMRRMVDNEHVVSHGGGTWDYVAGEFC